MGHSYTRGVGEGSRAGRRPAKELQRRGRGRRKGAMSWKSRKETVSRRRGGTAAKCAEVAEKKYREEPVDLLIRRLAAVSPPG